LMSGGIKTERGIHGETMEHKGASV
jgi:hypothetical protein